MKLKLSVLVVSALLLGFGSVAVAQQKVTFSHKNTKDGTITEILSLADGEKFIVEITDTDTSDFEYTVTGIEITPSNRLLTRSATTVTITMEHSAKYGGYYVKVRLQKGKKKNPGLKDKTWIISTEESGFHTDVNVGIMGTPLVDPKFYLEDDNGTKIVRRDKQAEDSVSFGFASFATIYHDRRPWIGGSLGLGLNDNDLAVLLGVTLRAGRRASLTIGYHSSKVDRLPTGVHVGDTFDGDNLILQDHSREDWFFAVSIRGFTDVFERKLAKDTTTK